MLLRLVLFFGAFSGILGDICESHPLETCQELLYSSQIFSIDGFPNAEQIKNACPTAASYLSCIENYKENCDYDEFGIFSSEKELAQVQDFVTDICDLKSSSHERYREHEECLTSLQENMPKCSEDAEYILKEFIKHKSSAVLERDKPYVPNNAHCVRKVHTLICILAEAMTTCGSQALELSLEVIKKSRLMLLFCRKMELYDFQAFIMEHEKYEDKNLLVAIFEAAKDA